MLTAATDHLARLVAFDTTSRNSNTDLIGHVADYLAAHGIASFRVESDDGRKASLFATIGPAVPGGIVLSGHTDVVPVDDQAWSSDPFTLVARGERLFGRGSCDMKGFIACVLALVPEFVRLPPAVPLHLAFSYDEEVGCLAAPALIEALLAAVPKPAFAIIGEPTEMRVVQAHRGIASFETSVTGRAGHSSKPEAGVNAIFAAAACIGAIAALAREDGRGQAPGERTTVNVGRIEGGTAVNIIAGHCRFLWECRSYDEASAERLRGGLDDWARDELLPPLRAVAPEANVETVRMVAAPPLLVVPTSPAVELALALSGQNGVESIAYASEAGLFQKAGVPAVVIGPGSVAQAHQPDEFVAQDQLGQCLDFLRRLGTWASRQNPA
ncbi:MAG: acetylornithine deacetylase [Rhodospirillales bacterium]